MRDSPIRTDAMYLWPTVEAVSGAQEVLRHLHIDRTVALATNAGQSDKTMIRLALQRVNLDQYIDEIYCFKSTGLKKPSPQFYEFILRDQAVDAAEALMVGNGFENDISGANRAGIYALWLNEENDEDRTSAMYETIHSLQEVLRFIK